jgi:hypothetical protein
MFTLTSGPIQTFQASESIPQKIYLFFGLSVYTLVESASDGTSGFEPVTPEARSNVLI